MKLKRRYPVTLMSVNPKLSKMIREVALLALLTVIVTADNFHNRRAQDALHQREVFSPFLRSANTKGAGQSCESSEECFVGFCDAWTHVCRKNIPLRLFRKRGERNF
ncbi:uncharacterized protein LOC142338342 [Convolutriloba macropyga]|uniref:uncharacterized protein LOC142338342 n=1 Tax=Convolutriloba macropyga TaxID=536237 RepID=UPI003F51B6EC